MLHRFRSYVRQLGMIRQVRGELRAARREIALLREAVGRVESRQTAAIAGSKLSDYEFRVFSQWGEDGIIQYLIRNIAVPDRSFIEFGVESYREANTRFLLLHDNWRGLIIDGSSENIARIKSEELYWRNNLTAVSAFITPGTIDELFSQNGFTGQIGLLSIDIDGMDYWVWKSISVVSPAIVVIEYNARFGPTRSVTVPFDEKFVRGTAHHSHIYYGASLAALVKLSEQKGYAFVGSNSAGSNAFFVRRDLMPDGWKSLTAAEGYVLCEVREARSPNGELAFLNREQEMALLKELPLVDVRI